MEKFPEIAQELPDLEYIIDTNNEGTAIERRFTAAMVLEIEKFFQEADADKRGGLNMKNICILMKKIYGSVTEEDLKVLYMKIGKHFDETVELGEFLTYLLVQYKATLSVRGDRDVFPKPNRVIRLGHYRSVVGLSFCPDEDCGKPDDDAEYLVEETRTCLKGQYVSISSDGIVNFWTGNFKIASMVKLVKPQKTLPFSLNTKMCVYDVVYIHELKEMAIATSDMELFFYTCSESAKYFHINYSVIVDYPVTTMHYWSNGVKAVFAFGDAMGYLSVSVSYNIQDNGLFNEEAFEAISEQEYPTVYMSSLLRITSKDFLYFRLPTLQRRCSQLRFFPALELVAVCDNKYMTMVLTSLPKPPEQRIDEKVFESKSFYGYFSCVDYSSFHMCMVTGGRDGIMRLWLPRVTGSCMKKVTGHIKPISHIIVNSRDKLVISLSEDKNVRIWDEENWLCLQSIQVQGMSQDPISSLYFNRHNNELVLANPDIAVFLGRGTDVFKNMCTSHEMPLCSALYHSIYKQLISVCQIGVVTVWDILTGKAVMEFSVTPDKRVGITAMSFEGMYGGLITASTDGKVRLWNFSTGAEVATLPVIVPKQVSDIVCVKNRAFVSMRTSKKIFDLDISGDKHRTFEHNFLNGVSSMSVHRTTLFAASSNGNVVAFDAQSLQALYWLNNTKSNNNIYTLDRKGQAKIRSLPVKSNQHRARAGSKKFQMNEKIDPYISPIALCLQTREVSTLTATLLTYENQNIHAWAIPVGCMLGKIKGTLDKDAIITTMSTDVNEHMLMTGDSTGHIYLWDIEQFGFTNKSDKELPPPPLISHWKGHNKAVVSIRCTPSRENIISAGLDCNVRLWTTMGHSIGIFGNDQWNASQLVCEMHMGRATQMGKVRRRTATGEGKLDGEEGKSAAEAGKPCLDKTSSILFLLDTAGDLNTKLEEVKRQIYFPIPVKKEIPKTIRELTAIKATLQQLTDKTSTCADNSPEYGPILKIQPKDPCPATVVKTSAPNTLPSIPE